MNENAVKIQVKIGQSEVSYEGPISFLRSDLFLFMKEAAVWCKTNTPPKEDIDSTASTETTPTANDDKKFDDISIDMIILELGSEKAQDLILAACTYLTFIKKKEKFSPDEILEVLDNAKGYFDEKKRKYFRRDLGRLVKKKFINKLQDNNYALRADKRRELEEKLGQQAI